jgi:hypothetical protein
MRDNRFWCAGDITLDGMDAYRQADLLSELIQIFPQFHSHWEQDNEDEEFRSDSLHSVYMSLLPVVSSFNPTPNQWRLFADHLSAAVAAGGDRENAADTCVLEHLHQVGLSSVLRPLLSNEARIYLRS